MVMVMVIVMVMVMGMVMVVMILDDGVADLLPRLLPPPLRLPQCV
jgi:hypothetical protein